MSIKTARRNHAIEDPPRPSTQVHFGLATAVLAEREQVLRAAYDRHPERWCTGCPALLRPRTDSAHSSSTLDSFQVSRSHT